MNPKTTGAAPSMDEASSVHVGRFHGTDGPVGCWILRVEDDGNGHRADVHVRAPRMRTPVYRIRVLDAPLWRVAITRSDVYRRAGQLGGNAPAAGDEREEFPRVARRSR